MSHSKTLLVKAVVMDNDVIEDVHLFSIEHKLFGQTSQDVVNALGKAFRAWYVSKPRAQEFVDANGINYGDATEIPDSFLEDFDIISYTQLMPTGTVALTYHDSISVNHDDALFDLGEADEFIDLKEGLIE